MSNEKFATGIMAMQLDSYLRRLRSTERLKPESERRRIPTIKELAARAGIHATTLSRIINGHTRFINLDTMQIIFTEMWRLGFEIEPNDLLSFEPPPNLVKEKSKKDNLFPPPPLTREQHRKYPGSEFVRAFDSESP